MSDPFPDRHLGLRDKIAWMVETNGFAIEPVLARPDDDPPQPGYTYTVGFETTFGHPEVVIFGLTPVAASGLLRMIGAHLAGGGGLPVDDEFVGLLDNDLRSALLPVDVEVRGHLFDGASLWYRDQGYRVLQFVWPDRNGWLPWEPGFDRRLSLAQPVIGVRAE
ncbi:MAG: DUF4262 domain-containing protein [Acidimicrobiales bacterium]|nr:DUF4262 domain-containing protein [Acidimicrobiales bacterium]